MHAECLWSNFAMRDVRFQTVRYETTNDDAVVKSIAGEATATIDTKGENDSEDGLVIQNRRFNKRGLCSLDSAPSVSYSFLSIDQCCL